MCSYGALKIRASTMEEPRFYFYSFFLIFLFNLFLNVSYFRERERELASGGGAEREGDRGSEAGSVLTAVTPHTGLQLTNR